MTTLTLPTITATARSRFGKVYNTRSYTSPFNGRTQTVAQLGSRWTATYVLPPMRRAKADEWVAFLARLQGMAGRFYGYDPDRRAPKGVATGTPLVQGGSQSGLSLVTDGWTAGVTGILKAGDMIAWDYSGGRELHLLVTDANSDGSGNATLTLDTAIRVAPANNEPLILTDPSCVMMLDTDSVSWDGDVAGMQTLSFAGIEAYGA